MNEEDIKILEEYTTDLFHSYKGEVILKATRNLLQGYKELKKHYINPSETRISYYDGKKETTVAIEGFIPKSLVEEKIEELKEQRRLLGFKSYIRREDMLNDDRAIACEISVLEELLKGDK